MLTSALISLFITQTPSLSDGRTIAKQLAEGRAAQVWRGGAKELRAQFKTQASFAAFVERLQALGGEVRVIAEGMEQRGALTVYRRTVAVENWARGFEVELSLDARGRLAGVLAQPVTKEAPTIYGRYATRARLRLPIEGQWTVLWGGRSWADNRHSGVSDMRYALDLLVREQGSSSAGDGTKNEQYYAWGRPVLAPGDGVVVFAEGQVADNEPNRPRGGNLYGNYVVVDHQNGEYSLLAHLRQGSLEVRVGDAVTAGQVLGRVGNSGMSTEPHVHYQLMDDADWRLAHGLPAQFRSYLSGTRLVTKGEPRREELVTSVPVEATN